MSDYETSLSEGLRAITGDLGVLSATWPDAFVRYKPIAAAIFTFDGQIAEAIGQLRHDRRAGIERLAAIRNRIMNYHWYVYSEVSRVVSGETGEGNEGYDRWQAGDK